MTYFRRSIFPALVIILLHVISCDGNKKHQHSHYHYTLSDLKDQFRHQHITKFKIDTFSWEERPEYYTQLDSTTFHWVWQDPTKEFMEKEVKHFLYSWQERDPNFIEITVLTQDGIDSCINTTYCIYDRQGKAIDNFVMNSSCKEDHWNFEEYGRFINDDTYEKIEVEMDETSRDTLANKETLEGDSTIFHYVIGKDGKVTEKEISKKHFIKTTKLR